MQQELDAMLDAMLDAWKRMEVGRLVVIGILHEEITCSGSPRVSPWCRAEDLECTGLDPQGGSFSMRQRVILHKIMPEPQEP